MRKLFTIETSDENEWAEVMKSIKESLNYRHFIGFEISLSYKIYNSNAFKEWLDIVSGECNNSDLYQFWRRDYCDFSGPSAVKKIIFSKAYKDEEIEAVREQRNGYARRVEELEEALNEYQYGIVPTLKEECKSQAKEITYLCEKIEKLNEANAELLERNKRLMNYNVLLKTKYDTANEILKEKQKNSRFIHNVTKSVNDYRINVVVDQVNDVIHIINEKFNETDSKLNDIAEHLEELDKFKDSIKKEGDKND